MEELIRGRPAYEMRLYTLSLIKTSSSLWERQEIQTEVQNCFLENCNYEWKPKDWHKITQRVLNVSDCCALVASILPELKDAIINTGVKIFEWIMHVRWEFGLDITHALPILWTPLGFVDEVGIFKSIWVNDPSLYVGSPDKPIFRIACMLAQEDFIREHQTEMIEELKKLPMEANLNNVDLEVVNYPDKVYGIISTYVCYLVKQDSENKAYYFDVCGIKESKEELEQRTGRQLDMDDDRGLLRKNMEKAINEGLILPPEMMAKLCGCPGLLHGIKYYMKKLNGAQKNEVNYWLLTYFGGICYVTIYNHQCRVRKFWEISAFVTEYWESLDRRRYFSDDLLCIFLQACPLESVLWPIVRNILNNVETTRWQLNGFLGTTFHFMKVDQYLGVPNTRYFYQKLLRNICATFDRRKMRSKLERLMSCIERYCCKVRDFTMLKTAYETDELIKFKGAVEYSRQSLFSQLGMNYAIPNLEIFEKFFDQMFDCPHDRIRFVLGAFHECHLLLECDFDMWEKLYSILDMPAPLRESIDPIKCLCSLGCSYPTFRDPLIPNIEKCEKFIKWWQQSSEEDQKNLKEKFKKSTHLSECIYNLWNEYFWNENKAQEKSFHLLQWLFDSEYEISKFKKQKLSILDLLNSSITLSNASFNRNNLFEKIDEFVTFSEATGESLANAKDEIRSKIEELICEYLTVYNIETFDFLMNWVSVSEEVKKKIFQNLMASSKTLKLSEDILSVDFPGSYFDVFFNEWMLKYCEDISRVKSYLLSKYKGLRSEYYMAELSSIYERLERGERLGNVENIWDLNLLG